MGILKTHVWRAANTWLNSVGLLTSFCEVDFYLCTYVAAGRGQTFRKHFLRHLRLVYRDNQWDDFFQGRLMPLIQAFVIQLESFGPKLELFCIEEENFVFYVLVL